MPDNLPRVPPLKTIQKRLPLIFSEGVEHRNYCVREMAARTIWVMLYAGAVEGFDRWARPSMITDMTDRQAAVLELDARNRWHAIARSQKKKRPANSWYAANSREPIRDETIRLGLIPAGAIIERTGLATTSSLPKYALTREFAALFDETLVGRALVATIASWQESNLNKAALARVTLLKKGISEAADTVLVRFPNGNTRTLAPGPSSVICKAVIEEFAGRYLEKPAVLWLSESATDWALGR